MNRLDREKKALEIFRAAGGVLRMSEAIHHGIHRRDLYRLRDEGKLEMLGRGLFRLRGLPDPALPDFQLISKKIPRGVICLISALAFHEMTTQIPHFVYVAVPQNAKNPSLAYPPLRLFWYGEKSLSTGVTVHLIDGCEVKIFDVEKTLVDVVKFRNKVGMDVVLEALRLSWRSGRVDQSKLHAYAKQFRVERILQPLLEAIASE